jgi:hypothetical protein
MVIASLWTNFPLIKVLLFQDTILNLPKTNEAIEKNHNQKNLDRLLKKGTLRFFLSFWLSAILNYILAIGLIKSDTGTTAFNKELGQVTLWNYPVIVFPCMVILMISFRKLISGLENSPNYSGKRLLYSATING